MATFSYTNLFSAGTPAVATQVNTNFNDVRTFAQGISTGTNIDSSAISEGKIANGAVTYSKLAPSATQFLAPVGSITMYTGTTAPAGWLMCDGVTSTATYTVLASLVGATTPNLQGRFPIGDNGTLALLGTGGSLTIGLNNLPAHSHPNTAAFTGTAASHNHTQDAHSHGMQEMGANTTDTSGVNAYVLTGASFDSVGGFRSILSTTATNQATSITPSGTVTMTNANNATTASDYYPPYYVVNYIIKHD